MIDFNQITNIPGNIQTTVLTFTNTGITRYLRQVGIEGEANGLWQIYINMVEVTDRRTTAVESSLAVDMFSHIIQIGDIIDVKVTHFRTELLAFSSEIIITDTPDENITVEINCDLDVPLAGILLSENSLVGEINLQAPLSGEMAIDLGLSSSISSSSDLSSEITYNKDFNGVMTCV